MVEYSAKKVVGVAAVTAGVLAAVYVAEGPTLAVLALLVMLLYLRTDSVWIPLGCIGYLALLHVAIKVNSRLPSYDATLWRVDGSLGFEPSAWAMGVLAGSPVLHLVAKMAYEFLPIALLLTALGSLQSGKFLARAGMAGWLGFLLYAVLPASVPLWYLNVETAAVKNAIPSLHMTWALMIRRELGHRNLFWRSLGNAFVVLTVLATVGLGEHYAVDLIAAVPFWLVVEWAGSGLAVEKESLDTGRLIWYTEFGWKGYQDGQRGVDEVGGFRRLPVRVCGDGGSGPLDGVESGSLGGPDGDEVPSLVESQVGGRDAQETEIG